MGKTNTESPCRTAQLRMGLRAPLSGLTILNEVSVYYFFSFTSFDQELSLKSLLTKSQVFSVSGLLSLYAKKDLSGVSCPISGENLQIWKPILV